MSTTLEHEIRRAFERLAEHTTIDPEARFGERAGLRLAAPRRRSTRQLVAWSAAAATAAVVTGGVVVTSRSSSDPTETTAMPAAPTGQPVPVELGAPVGVFPPGDRDAVVAAGYASPEAAVDAYLTDRTRSEVLPPGVEMTYTLSDSTRTATDSALVGFNLQGLEDSGDGVLQTVLVTGPGEPERWAVVGGGIATFRIDELDLHDGRLSGSYTEGVAGDVAIGVYDAHTGEPLGTVSASPFVIDGLPPGGVTVRFWETRATAGYGLAVFAEALVRDGETVTAVGFDALADAYFGVDVGPSIANESVPESSTG